MSMSHRPATPRAMEFPADVEMEMDDSHLPKSSSSAMPDLQAATVPRLKAKVHRLTPDRLKQISLSDLCYRPLQASDMDEMIALHQEWFPVSYDQDFYNKSVTGNLHSIVAVLPPNGGSHVAPALPSGQTAEENILGMITISTYCEHHKEAIAHILGADCDMACRSRDAEEGGTGALAYILTLGIAEGFRRRGLARELIRRSVEQVESDLPEVQAVFLHVVTYNTAAIQLYESCRFLKIEYFPRFYFLHGKHYDSFLYAHYLHGHRPPWKWRVKNLASVWGQWMLSYWTALWQPSCEGRST